MDIITKYGTARLIENCVLQGSSETYQWYTEVHESYSGQEDREALRDIPRISYDIDLGNGDIFYGDIRGLFALPLKWQAVPCVIDGDFVIVDTSLNPDLGIGYAVINGTNVEIMSVGREIEVTIDEEVVLEYQDGFVLSAPLDDTEGTVYPLRICILNGDASINAGYNNKTYKVQFDVLVEDLPMGTPATMPQYQSKDVYLDSIQAQSPTIDISLTQHQNIVDNTTGAFQNYTHHARAKTIVPRFYLLKNLQEQFDFKKFLLRRAGRYREFWMPQPFNKGKMAAHYATKFLDGRWEVGIGTTNVDYICPLVLYRLDADNVQIELGGNNTARTTLAVTELL